VVLSRIIPPDDEALLRDCFGWFRTSTSLAMTGLADKWEEGLGGEAAQPFPKNLQQNPSLRGGTTKQSLS